ncbi:MAG: adventurous gliding motility protein GltC [Deltaproteobacteria bacterium]|nr:adventurous gliding motility protein GltC [Deltaproteobacteria bacterium]
MSFRYLTVMVAAVALLAGPPSEGWMSRAAAQDDDWGFDFSDDASKKKKKKEKKKEKKKDEKTKPEQKPAAAQAEEMDLGFEALDVSVKSAEKEAMEKALDLMKDEKYAEAATSLWEIYNNPRAKQYFQSAEYQLAKALYRMRMYHSALRHFGQILEKGVSHKYFKTSLEWLFFISHKITDQKAVLGYIAKYSDVEFPKKYKDEFLFLLAKYFYFRALDLEKEKVKPEAPKPAKPPKPKPKPEGEFGGGFDLSGEGGGGMDLSGEGGGGLDLSGEGGGGLDLSGEGGGGLDLSGEGGGMDLSGGEQAGGGFELDLGGEKKAGPTALPTDVVGFLSKSRALILQVDEKSKFFPRGKYLEGIILYKEGNFTESVNAFKEVVRILHPTTGKFRDDRLREMAFFQLARIHYEHKQFHFALFYYDRIDRDSLNWLESLFEASWAWFRLGKYQKALGNLITLDSPFFREEYFPEGLVLKAVTYYENCRYPESNQIVKEFRRRYEPLLQELKKLTSKEQEPEKYYNNLLAIQKAPEEGKSGKMLRRILKVALADDDLKVLNKSVLEIDRELKRIRARMASASTSRLVKRLKDELDRRRKELVVQAGVLTKSRLEQEKRFLGGLMSQALRIKLENDQSELDMLKRIKAGELDLGPTLLTYEWTAATDDEKIYWPYEGEYWRDELGTYEYTLTWGCRARGE